MQLNTNLAPAAAAARPRAAAAPAHDAHARARGQVPVPVLRFLELLQVPSLPRHVHHKETRLRTSTISRTSARRAGEGALPRPAAARRLAQRKEEKAVGPVYARRLRGGVIFVREVRARCAPPGRKLRGAVGCISESGTLRSTTTRQRFLCARITAHVGSAYIPRCLEPHGRFHKPGAIKQKDIQIPDRRSSQVKSYPRENMEGTRDGRTRGHCAFTYLPPFVFVLMAYWPPSGRVPHLAGV